MSWRSGATACGSRRGHATAPHGTERPSTFRWCPIDSLHMLILSTISDMRVRAGGCYVVAMHSAL
jgi:hypothetical protein